jgi:hypothetical protein
MGLVLFVLVLVSLRIAWAIGYARGVGAAREAPMGDGGVSFEFTCLDPGPLGLGHSDDDLFSTADAIEDRMMADWTPPECVTKETIGDQGGRYRAMARGADGLLTIRHPGHDR